MRRRRGKGATGFRIISTDRRSPRAPACRCGWSEGSPGAREPSRTWDEASSASLSGKERNKARRRGRVQSWGIEDRTEGSVAEPMGGLRRMPRPLPMGWASPPRRRHSGMDTNDRPTGTCDECPSTPWIALRALWVRAVSRGIRAGSGGAGVPAHGGGYHGNRSGHSFPHPVVRPG